MNRTLGDFNAKEHSGVKEELNKLKKRLETIGNYDFGSSGEGEMTIQWENGSAYAKKYKRKNGWRVVYCPRPGSNFTNYEASIDKIIEQIQKLNL